MAGSLNRLHCARIALESGDVMNAGEEDAMALRVVGRSGRN
jgi:hypothetical protein